MTGKSTLGMPSECLVRASARNQCWRQERIDDGRASRAPGTGGLFECQTYIQSGNVVFKSSESDGVAVGTVIEKAC